MHTYQYLDHSRSAISAIKSSMSSFGEVEGAAAGKKSMVGYQSTTEGWRWDTSLKGAFSPYDKNTKVGVLPLTDGCAAEGTATLTEDTEGPARRGLLA